MDWNWFFSSIAQSAAAIVGIFAAFIIAKVVSNQTEFAQKNRLLNELIADCNSMVDEASKRSFDWYNKKIFNALVEDIKEKYYKTEQFSTPEEYYKEGKFSVFESRQEVLKKLEPICQEFREKENAKKQAAELYIKSHPGHGYIRNMMPYFPDTSAYELRNKAQSEREAIDDLLVRTNKLRERIRNFHDENISNPESSPLVTYSLLLTALLFYVGVIYPLSFLPLKIDEKWMISIGAFWDVLFSIRGFLLFTTAVIFTVILIIFIGVNVSLKLSREKMSTLDAFKMLGSFSTYFKNLEDNQTYFKNLNSDTIE